MKVFSAHRQANSVGQILGPLVAGALGLWFGWRAPFFVFAIPTLVFVVLALRLRGLDAAMAALKATVAPEVQKAQDDRKGKKSSS